MTQTSGLKYAPGYDLFKLIVAVILTIILILLLLRESRGRFAGLNLTAAAPSETESVVLPTMTSQPSPFPTSTPTPILLPTSTEPIPIGPTLVEPTPTELIPTEEPPPTGSVPTQPIPVSDPNECPSAPSHIQVGDKVRVLNWLYFRTGAGLNSPITLVNKPGTEMDVIGGPLCTIRIKTGEESKAYLWWYVRMKDGREGWSAEAPLNDPDYLLEPIQ